MTKGLSPGLGRPTWPSITRHAGRPAVIPGFTREPRCQMPITSHSADSSAKFPRSRACAGASSAHAEACHARQKKRQKENVMPDLIRHLSPRVGPWYAYRSGPDWSAVISGDVVRGELAQQHDYQFIARFGDAVPDLLADEPSPLGAGAGPSPVQLLATAVGSCLSNSLLFALRKFKQKPEPISCVVEAGVGRNEEGRLRVLTIKAMLTLGVAESSLEHLARALEQFEAFCTVTQSVDKGIDVTVEVWDAGGLRLK